MPGLHEVLPWPIPRLRQYNTTATTAEVEQEFLLNTNHKHLEQSLDFLVETYSKHLPYYTNLISNFLKFKLLLSTCTKTKVSFN